MPFGASTIWDTTVCIVVIAIVGRESYLEPMAKQPARSQTSFRFEPLLLKKLDEVARETGRNRRQVVELSLQLMLPLMESGYIDSPKGSLVLGELEPKLAIREELDPKVLNAMLLGKPLGKALKALKAKSAKSRNLLVLRLDGELLRRVRAAAKLTGRNDRQVIEKCLRLGLPLLPSLALIRPRLVALTMAWEDYQADMAKTPRPVLFPLKVKALTTAQEEFMKASLAATQWGARSEEEAQDSKGRERTLDEIDVFFNDLIDLIDEWRKRHGWRGLPRSFAVEQRRSDGQWVCQITDQSPAVTQLAQKPNGDNSPRTNSAKTPLTTKPVSKGKKRPKPKA